MVVFIILYKKKIYTKNKIISISAVKNYYKLNP